MRRGVADVPGDDAASGLVEDLGGELHRKFGAGKAEKFAGQHQRHPSRRDGHRTPAAGRKLSPTHRTLWDDEQTSP